MIALHSNFEESFLKFIDPFCPPDKREKERFTLTTRDLICKAIRQSTPRVQISDPFFQCRYDVSVIAQETGIDLFMSSTKELSDKKVNEAFFYSNFFKNDEVSVLSTLTGHVVFYGTRPYFPQDLKEKIDLRKLPAHTNFGFILRGKKDDDIKEHFQGIFNLTFYPLKVETEHSQAYFPICGSSNLQGYRRLRWTEEDEKEFWDEMVREIVQNTPLQKKFLSPKKMQKIDLNVFKGKITYKDAIIKIGRKDVCLVPDTDEDCFCKAMFKSKPGKAVDRSIVYEAMTGDEFKNTKANVRKLRDAMQRVNKKVQQALNTSQRLFRRANKTFICNF